MHTQPPLWQTRAEAIKSRVGAINVQQVLQVEKGRDNRALTIVTESHITESIRGISPRMSLARPSVAFEPSPSDPTFFEREKERLIEEISAVGDSSFVVGHCPGDGICIFRVRRGTAYDRRCVISLTLSPSRSL